MYSNNLNNVKIFALSIVLGQIHVGIHLGKRIVPCGHPKVNSDMNLAWNNAHGED